jgi:hypothetical protein
MKFCQCTNGNVSLEAQGGVLFIFIFPAVYFTFLEHEEMMSTLPCQSSWEERAGSSPHNLIVELTAV